MEVVLQPFQVIIVFKELPIGGKDTGAFGRLDQLAGHSAKLVPELIDL